MPLKPSKDVLANALDLFQSGNKPQAYLYLKERCGMSVPDAKTTLEDAMKAVVKGEGTTSEDERAIEEAMDAAVTMDELTVNVLRQLRDTKQEIGDHKPSPAVVMASCTAIYDGMRNLIAHDVNPTRAMLAFLRDIASQTDPAQLAQDERKLFDAATTSTLRNDILQML